jgi:hypothetical protein
MRLQVYRAWPAAGAAWLRPTRCVAGLHRRDAESFMVKAEWGTKRACPKCNTRFYDLGKEDPVTCISCGFAWVPEPILKSKQTTPFEAAKPLVAEGEDVVTAVDEDLDLDTDVEAGEADGDVDLGGDDDLGVVSEGDEEEN